MRQYWPPNLGLLSINKTGAPAAAAARAALNPAGPAPTITTL